MVALPFLSKKENLPYKFITLSINAEIIRALAFYYDQNSFRIIGSGSHGVEKGAIRNGRIINEEIVTESVREALYEATKDIEEDIENVIIGLGGDTCLGLVTTVRSKRTLSEPINKREAQDFFKKIQNAAKEQAQEIFYFSTGEKDIALETITSSTVYILLDGNRVNILQGEEGNIVEAAIYNSLCPISHLSQIQKISKKLKFKIIAIGPELYALSEWIKEKTSKLLDFVVMDIAEDSTNVGVVFGGALTMTKTLNFGYMHFVEGISNKTGITEKEAEKVFKSYISNNLSESEMGVIKSCVNEILGIWLTGVEILFKEFADVKRFAPRIFVTGVGSQIGDVFNILESEPWTKDIQFQDVPDFLKLKLSEFDRINDSTGKAKTAEWVNVASIAKFYEQIIGVQSE